MSRQNGCPVKYRDVTYASGAALARHLGISRQRIYRTLDRDGHLENLCTQPSTSGAGRPVHHRGVDYPSHGSLARHLGVTRPTVSQHLRTYGHCENIDGDGRNKPVIIGGIWFPTQKSAAETAGVSSALMSRALAGSRDSLAFARIEAAVVRAYAERRLGVPA